MTQMLCEALEHAPRCVAIPCAHAVESFGDGRFDRGLPSGIGAAATLCEAQDGPATIARIVGANEQALSDQPLDHARQRARMDVQNRREVAG